MLACFSAPAQADPAPATVPDVVYKATLDGDTIHTTLWDATFVVSDDQRTVDVRDDAGRTVITMPLSFDQDRTEYPMPHVVSDDGHQLDLTVVKDPANARPAPVTDIASPAEDQMAMNSFASQFGIATAVGGFIGTSLGAIVGFIAGLPLGGPIGAIPGAITGATIGGIVGTMAVGGPVLMVSGFDLINSLRSPAGTTKWADNGSPTIPQVPASEAPGQASVPAN